MLTYVVTLVKGTAPSPAHHLCVYAHAYNKTMAGRATAKAAEAQQKAGLPLPVKAYLLLYNGALVAG